MKKQEFNQLKQDFCIFKKQIINDFQNHNNPYIFFYQYDCLVRKYIIFLFNFVIKAINITVIATGGFGRKELYPFSDIDIAVVYKKCNLNLEKKIVKFIQCLWDTGLEPSVQVGTSNQLINLTKNDLSLETLFLESSYIVGNENIFHEFNKNLNLHRNLVNFIDGKKLEFDIRNDKNQGSTTQLEPNLKNFSGLRDIHTIIWITKALGLSTNFNQLRKQNFINSTEYRILLINHKNLAKIRIYLHICANKLEDRLLFDYQLDVANKLGFNHVCANKNTEALMSIVYKSTRNIKQISTIIIPYVISKVYLPFPRHIYKINNVYYKIDNNLAVKDKNVFIHDSTQIFNFAKIFQKNKDISGIEPETLYAWWKATRNINTAFKQNDLNKKIFINFFKHGSGITHLLRFLNLYGVLEKYLYPFAKIRGLLQNDLFHIYPVDEHLIMVVKYLRRLEMEEYFNELPFVSALMYTFKYKYILYLGALLHDIAKGSNIAHEDLGAKYAKEFAINHNLPKRQIDLLSWLVQNHLLMSTTAQKKDINDIKVIEEFCKIVNTKTKLIALYILTVSDIRGTNPKIWNEWKSDLLQSLFEFANNFITKKNKYKDLEKQKIRTVINIAKKNNIQDINSILKKLGQSYLFRFSLEEIKKQLSLIIKNINTPNFFIQKIDQHTIELIIYTKDRGRLFADICLSLLYISLEVLRARAYTTYHNFSLDSFTLLIPENFNNNDIQKITNKLTTSMNDLIIQKIPIKNISINQNVNRRIKYNPIIPRVSITKNINNDLEQLYTLSIICPNKIGILAKVAIIMSDFKIKIKNARINTLDQRVEDTFLISSNNLDNTSIQLKFKKSILNVL